MSTTRAPAGHGPGAVPGRAEPPALESPPMSRFLLICLGGAVGTGARYVIAIAAPRYLGPSFPYATLIVNAAGSFLLGAVMHVGLTTALMSPGLRVVLATGVLGGFTT